MTTTTQLYARVRYVANEVTTAVTWTNTELDGWCNDGIRSIIKLDPAASIAERNISLIAGARQPFGQVSVVGSNPLAYVSDDLNVLVDVIGNVDSNGAPGRQVRIADRASLDAMYPNWQGESEKTYVRNYMYDPRSPHIMWVYPPVVSDTRLKTLVSFFPADVTYAGNHVLPVESRYEPPLMDYMLYRMFSKDVEDAGNDSRAMAYFQQFSGGVANIVTARNGGSQQKE